MENNDYEDDEIYDGMTEHIMPFLRIYVSAGKKDHDLLDLDELINWMTSENKSINDTIKELLDQGMVNVYACSFHRTMKVL